MNISYYKTASPELLGAYRDLMSAVHTMRDKAREVCAQFDATPVIGQCVSSYTYHGVKLNNYSKREDAHLWTKPDKTRGFLSKPRARLTGFAAEIKALKEQFTQVHGDMEESVSKDEFYTLLGLDWSLVLITGGFSAFESNEHLYLTSATTLVGLEEITASEFKAAKQASEDQS